MSSTKPICMYVDELPYQGGAWKVAYADFVTAMMAFFLLMWLLNATSEEQKKGLAEYFTPTIGLKDQMGIGFEGGEAPTEDGTDKSNLSKPGLVSGRVQQGPVAEAPDRNVMEGNEELTLFDRAQQEMREAMESDPNLRDLTENIFMEQTPEGLKVELRDSDNVSMFETGSAKLSKKGREILRAMIPVIRRLPNHLSITGHTDAMPYEGKRDYTNWELSTDRALSTRRYLERNKMTKQRVKKIVGRAAEELALPDDPYSPINRRIELILLRGSHLSLLPQNQTAPRSLLSVPNVEDTLKKREKSIQKQEELDKMKAEAEAAASAEEGGATNEQTDAVGEEVVQ